MNLTPDVCISSFKLAHNFNMTPFTIRSYMVFTCGIAYILCRDYFLGQSTVTSHQGSGLIWHNSANKVEQHVIVQDNI
jgi:hypothetical protein